MRPITLIMSAWGPYRDKEQIEFQSLSNENLFLITGKTGSGKTSIFDAIAYALYGNLSGDNREKNSVRSDFAKGDIETFVELTFLHRNKTYIIRRNPEYLRPKKRKVGSDEMTKEKERALLTYEDGKVIEGNIDVTNAIKEILSLDYQQFRQVSMLSQGEFSRLLTATPVEKTKIFRDIFGTNQYAIFTEKLKEEASASYRAVQILQTQIDEAIHLIELQNEEWVEIKTRTKFSNEELLGYLEKEKERQKIVLKQLEKEEIEMDQILERENKIESLAKRDNEQIEKLEEITRDREAILKKKEEMNVLILQKEKGRLAQKLVSVWEQILLIKEQYQKSQEKLTKINTEQCSLKEALDSFKQHYEKKEDILESIKNRIQLIQKKQEFDAYTIEVKKLEKKREKEQELYLRLQQEEQRARDNFFAEEQKIRFGAIGIVAALIKEGEPCPVCGSIQHPNIAKAEHEVLKESEMEELKKQWQDKEKKCQSIYKNVIQYVEEEKQIKEAYEKEETSIKELMEKYQDAIKGETIQSLGKKEESFLKNITKYENASVLFVEKKRQEEELKLELEKQKQIFREKQELFAIQLKEFGFDSSEEFQKSLLSETKLKAIETEILQYQENVAKLEELFVHYKELIKDKKKIDLEPIYQKIQQIKGEKLIRNDKKRKIQILLDQITRSKKSIEEKEEKIRIQKEKYGVVQDLVNIATGNNRKKIVFEQFVLAYYFEDILRAANIRLRDMTSGRYELSRINKVTDGRSKDNLEIQVMDYYTGKNRSIKTLSGGETFKTSLCLALGLSDVAQASSGGIYVEALFIDEGFGSLDEEAINQACNVLNSLVEGNRMIGIISHVDELKVRITSQIQIDKSLTGSYIKNIV
ncbi:MAG: AAA family ATPase [Lachnospiraceae bacterium]